MDPNLLAPMLQNMSPHQIAQMMMQQRMGLDELVDIKFTSASSSEVLAQCSITSQHLQPYGLVHGGLYCSLGESLCSIGGFLQALPLGKFIVGRENRTRFHKGARKGALLTIRAIRAQSTVESHLLWSFEVKEDQKLCASGTVLLALLEPKSNVGGEDLQLLNEITQNIPPA
ncbi:MAG: hypothetical protein CMK59_05720 [Proteobacteria bacterium]|nr:hypothetical protein [Pseudomonadota bacterium]